jgi:hypothetical protein
MGWWGRAWQNNLKETALERQNNPSPAIPTSSIPKLTKS